MNKLKIQRMQWHVVAFAVCLAASIGLIVGGFFVPPTGVIDGSVLTAVGLLFGYATLGQIHFLVARGKGVVVNHGSTSISVGSRGADVSNDSNMSDKLEGDEDPC